MTSKFARAAAIAGLLATGAAPFVATPASVMQAGASIPAGMIGIWTNNAGVRAEIESIDPFRARLRLRDAGGAIQLEAELQLTSQADLVSGRWQSPQDPRINGLLTATLADGRLRIEPRPGTSIDPAVDAYALEFARQTVVDTSFAYSGAAPATPMPTPAPAPSSAQPAAWLGSWVNKDGARFEIESAGGGKIRARLVRDNGVKIDSELDLATGTDRIRGRWHAPHDPRLDGQFVLILLSDGRLGFETPPRTSTDPAMNGPSLDYAATTVTDFAFTRTASAPGPVPSQPQPQPQPPQPQPAPPKPQQPDEPAPSAETFKRVGSFSVRIDKIDAPREDRLFHVYLTLRNDSARPLLQAENLVVRFEDSDGIGVESGQALRAKPGYPEGFGASPTTRPGGELRVKYVFDRQPGVRPVRVIAIQGDREAEFPIE